MKDETTRRRAEDRRTEPLAETEVEPSGAPVDEDAAAFLQEAAEAAAAAALDAQTLADEVESELASFAQPAPRAVDEQRTDRSAEPGARTSEALGDDEIDAAPDRDHAPAAIEEAASGDPDQREEVGSAVESDGTTSELSAGDCANGDREEGAPDALHAARDSGPAPDAGDDADAREADLAALDEAAPTAEEEALAQAADATDEEDVAPAEIAEPEEEPNGSFEKLAARARRLDDEQARHVIHSILFVADKPLTVEHLRNATGLEPARIRKALERLAGELREGISGVILSEVAGGWQLRTAPESAEFVRRFLQVKPRRLTRAALETLAIIAYRQPVTRPEIEEIRGVDSGAVLKALLDWKLIKILGKKDEVGRPLLYGTSREFLEFFQLKDLASLPTLREFHELSEESVQIVEEELGPEAAAGIAGTVAELVDPSYLEAEKERVAKSEQALAELEQALADAEAKAADVAQTIAPSKPAGSAPESEAWAAPHRGSVMAEERLQKILSRAGVASRRAAEELILAGRVQVNGKVVRELGTRADPRRDVIRVDDRAIAEPEELVWYVLYKPERVVTTLSDPQGRRTVGDLLRGVDARVYPVGRLDYDAEGVLLLTNDGDLAHKLTHPRWGARRTYLAKVKGEPSDEALRRLLDGVRLEDGMARAIEATFEKRTQKNTWIRLVVAEGRHHLVKRLCEAIGHPVLRLFRAEYAGVKADGLLPGEIRPLTRREIQALREAVAKEAPPPPGGKRRKPPRPGAGAVRNPILGAAGHARAAQTAHPPSGSRTPRGALREGRPSGGRAGARAEVAPGRRSAPVAGGKARAASGRGNAPRQGGSTRGPRAARGKPAAPARGPSRSGRRSSRQSNY